MTGVLPSRKTDRQARLNTAQHNSKQNKTKQNKTKQNYFCPTGTSHEHVGGALVFYTKFAVMPHQGSPSYVLWCLRDCPDDWTGASAGHRRLFMCRDVKSANISHGHEFNGRIHVWVMGYIHFLQIFMNASACGVNSALFSHSSHTRTTTNNHSLHPFLFGIICPTVGLTDRWLTLQLFSNIETKQISNAPGETCGRKICSPTWRANWIRATPLRA